MNNTAVSSAARNPVASSESLWLYALFALLATAGFFYVNIMGAIVDGLVTGLRFSTTQAGMVGAANIYGASVGALVAVFIVRHVRWRVALATLLCILLAIDLASLRIVEPILLTVVRAVHGLAGGMAVGGVLVCLTTLPQAASLSIPSWLDGRTDPAAYAATGAFGMMLFMLAGYTVVWAWWWITRMRE